MVIYYCFNKQITELCFELCTNICTLYSQFVDDGNVWITIHPLSKLQEYEREASLYASEASHNNIPPKKSEMCLVKWKGTWCRAEVKRAFVSLKYGTVAEYVI